LSLSRFLDETTMKLNLSTKGLILNALCMGKRKEIHQRSIHATVDPHQQKKAILICEELYVVESHQFT